MQLNIRKWRCDWDRFTLNTNLPLNCIWPSLLGSGEFQTSIRWIYCSKSHYYKANSMRFKLNQICAVIGYPSWQDGARSGSRAVSRKKTSPKPYTCNPYLPSLYGRDGWRLALNPFSEFLWTETEKKIERGQYRVVLASCLVNNPSRPIKSSSIDLSLFSLLLSGGYVSPRPRGWFCRQLHQIACRYWYF